MFGWEEETTRRYCASQAPSHPVDVLLMDVSTGVTCTQGSFPKLAKSNVSY